MYFFFLGKKWLKRYFLYTLARLISFGRNFQFLIFFGVFSKNDYFLGWRFLRIFFGVISSFDYFDGLFL